MIDICPECKGVWLDLGDFEKLMSGIREVQQASKLFPRPIPPMVDR
ncbi:zf-TFIIB domain-containing protein [Cohnella sp. NL03-T5]|nr:zf-TFIIB domain-containing protein [Cohnella silvisoli]MCD9021057.1 zf-TFIIB domain-containing protein [Cohnella silvisoli]